MDLSWLKKGIVVRDEFQEIENVKIKMAVLVGVTPNGLDAKFLMINSQITAKARSRLEIRDRQFAIDGYTFLNYLSYVNCAQVISRPLELLLKRMEEGKARVCGELREADLCKAIQEVQKAVTVKPKDKYTAINPLPNMK